MNIVTLLGSPRPKGNSTTIANAFIKTAEKLNADVQTFALNKLSYKACQACETCKTKLDHCVLKDDLTQVLEAVQQADILVLASPVYFADISAQLKTFIDRCFSFLSYPEVNEDATRMEPYPDGNRLAPNKQVVLILTQNQPDELFADLAVKYDLIFQFIGFKEIHVIRGCNLGAADDIKTKSRDDLIEQAEETARKLIQ